MLNSSVELISIAITVLAFLLGIAYKLGELAHRVSTVEEEAKAKASHEEVISINEKLKQIQESISKLFDLERENRMT